jgi:hypothetical protein
VENGLPHHQGKHAGERPTASAVRVPLVLLLIAALAMSFLCLAIAGVAFGSPAQQPPMVLPGATAASSYQRTTSDSGRWILGALPGAAAERIALRSGASAVSRADGIYSIRREGANRFAGALRRAGILVYAEPDARMLPAGYPVDLSLGTQWWLDRIVNTIETTPPPVTANSPRLGLIEESLDPLHPDLVEASIANARSIGPVEDDHGTSIAAIAGSPVETSGLPTDQNIVGVWPGMNMTLFPSGTDCITSTRAVLDAARARIPVINMSYGFARNECFSHFVATETAVRNGVLPVAAAGNTFETGNVAMRPASDPHVISVSAVDKDNLVASFATRNPKVDITAPGDGMIAPIINLPSGGGVDVERTWGEISGTSYSSPMVAAAATWMRQARPELTARQIFRALTDSATDLGTPGRDAAYGEGLLNIDSALAAPAPPADPGEPNNDIQWINGSLLRGASPYLWKPGGPRRGVAVATLSRYKDAADVYRVRLARKSRVLITTAQLQGDVQLRVYRPRAKTITRGRAQIIVRSDRVRPKTEGVQVINRQRRAQVVYVSITPSARQSDEYMRYRVSVARR